MSKAYEERTDLEKIQSQWHKLTGLHTREEWSAAIVRAATAAELAANFAIRREFQARGDFNSEFVNSLLRWANGLSGKIDHLLLPLSAGRKQQKTIKTLRAVSDLIVIQETREFIEILVRLYEPEFALKEKRGKSAKTF